MADKQVESVELSGKSGRMFRDLLDKNTALQGKVTRLRGVMAEVLKGLKDTYPELPTPGCPCGVCESIGKLADALLPTTAQVPEKDGGNDAPSLREALAKARAALQEAKP